MVADWSTEVFSVIRRRFGLESPDVFSESLNGNVRDKAVVYWVNADSDNVK